MKSWLVCLSGLLLLQSVSTAQSRREDIYSGFVLYDKRAWLEKDLRENVIGRTFTQPVDSNSEYRFESACLAISQFQFTGTGITQGFDKLFLQYDSLQYDTKRALLEAVYATYPNSYAPQVQAILQKETHPKLFAMCAAYLFRQDTSTNNINNIKIRMVEQFSNYDSIPLLLALENHLNSWLPNSTHKTPDIAALFSYQAVRKQKTIYSFQRWNRDYPGLAIVQDVTGRFMRHPDGRLMIFEQLARSASNLPYFITNGSTPQGIYSIQGTAVSGNTFIGPTPNLQLVMPNESNWDKYFQLPPWEHWDSTRDSMQAYLELLPPAWRKYTPATEAFYAGLIGRTEIIAHGTTIDPEYFKNKPWYPLTPTNGCLCAKELWNVSNGRLLVSEQFNLVSTFMATPGNKGYLFVINLDDQQAPVTRAELERYVKAYERGK
ncbi:hypothetical protein HB364_19050 [Pseudoflavitalea sp. X16]|uniref:hypothetical protein n=1 Tax=Paraflavitalea devenefica TaxID=2716334 RepID=UPI0014225FF2|nr:hypothetical protein [Paraflavitalea devenefica]NII27194.1 hypothetical protein [Paraflavitalea devenefica]